MNELVRKFTLHYLKTLASLQLRKVNPDVIGITGSAGKTSCRVATSLILGSEYKIRSTTGGLNSEWGVPLYILGQQNQFQDLVKI